MEYTNNLDFVRDEMFSGLAPPPDAIQDTWIGGNVTESTENGSANHEYMQYNDTSNYGETNHPDLLLGSDDEIDKVVHQLFQRERTDSNGSLPVPEANRTPSPPQDGFFEERIVEGGPCGESNVDFSNNTPGILNIEHILRDCDAVQSDGNSYRILSPPNEENICLVAQEEYKEEEESFSHFSINAPPGGSNIGYVATTFAPAPILTSGDIPPPFGFYSSMSLPRDSVINAASFVTRLSSLQPGHAVAGRVRGNTAIPVPRQYAYGFTPRAMSSPKVEAGRAVPMLQENIHQFYQPTIRRNRPASIEERSPLIAALLKSQASIFTQPPIEHHKPEASILMDTNSTPAPNVAHQNLVQILENSTPVAAKRPRQRKQLFLREEHNVIVEPTVITLDDSDEKEELQILEDSGSVFSYLPYQPTPAKNPSVLVFPNMRDFSVGDPTIFKTRRFSLCEQSKIIVGRVLAYNKEVRRRMGSGYVGPWLSPVKLTSNMTGVSTSVVKQCEAYSMRVLTRCSSEIKQSFKFAAGEPFPAERYQLVRPVSVLSQAMPIAMKRAPFVSEGDCTISATSVSSKSTSPQPETPEFDWSSLYNGQPPRNDQRKLSLRKRSLVAADMIKDGIIPEKRIRSQFESIGKEGIPEDVNAISNLLMELVDKVSEDISPGSFRRSHPFPYRTLKDVLSDSNALEKPGLGTGIIRRTLVRCSQSKRSVPDPFQGNSNPQRCYNFRPRESIVKKRFFD